MKTSKNQKIKRTQLGKSYWDNSGIYQKEYDELYAKHVPTSGMCKTTHGELVRAVGRLSYEYCNNGNMNAAETDYEIEETTCMRCRGTGYVEEDEECEDCYGCGSISEEVEAETTVSKFYQGFLDLIHEEVKTTHPEITLSILAVTALITGGMRHSNNYFCDEYMNSYNSLIDFTIHHVLSTEDTPISDRYLNLFHS